MSPMSGCVAIAAEAAVGAGRPIVLVIVSFMDDFITAKHLLQSKVRLRSAINGPCVVLCAPRLPHGRTSSTQGLTGHIPKILHHGREYRPDADRRPPELMVEARRGAPKKLDSASGRRPGRRQRTASGRFESSPSKVTSQAPREREPACSRRRADGLEDGQRDRREVEAQEAP